MKVLALTGGIASGKSTVAKMFEELGATLIDADSLAHQVYSPGTPLATELLRRYGNEIKDSQGGIDRKALGKIIFRTPEERRWLENKTHPATRKKIAEQIQEARARHAPLVLVEAALHVETGYYKEFDGLIVVHADPQIQIQRLQARDGMSREEAEQRLKNQMTGQEKESLADWVIDNNGSLKDTKKEVQDLFGKLLGERSK